MGTEKIVQQKERKRAGGQQRVFRSVASDRQSTLTNRKTSRESSGEKELLMEPRNKDNNTMGVSSMKSSSLSRAKNGEMKGGWKKVGGGYKSYRAIAKKEKSFTTW